MQSQYFVCDYCSRSFTRKYNLVTHIENFHVSATWFCEICSKTFGNSTGLQLHLSRGHNSQGQGLPECDLCGRIFTRKPNLISHMISVHFQMLQTRSICNICNKTFRTVRNLKRHMNQIHNPEVQYPTCDYCKKVFKGKMSLISHIQALHNVTDSDTNHCYLCDKRFFNNRNLRRHIEMLHGEREEYKCDMCPKIFMSYASLRRHTISSHSHSPKQLTCEFCSRTFHGRENLKNHILIQHKDVENFSSDSENKIKCEYCQKSFYDHSVVRQHVKNDHSFQMFYDYCRKSLLKALAQTEGRQKIYPCDSCSHVSSTIYELKGHLKNSHDITYSLSTCNVCFKQFYSKQSILKHKKTCLPPRGVNSCAYCEKLFTDISSLEFHARIFHPQNQIADSNVSSSFDDSENYPSLNSKLYNYEYTTRNSERVVELRHSEIEQCGLCNKTFRNRKDLVSHMKIHSNDTKCHFCGKEFRSTLELRRHIEFVHTGKSRYKCMECEAFFVHKRSLRKHVRSKHPNSLTQDQLKLQEKTFSCDICSVSFNSQHLLDAHISTKHLDQDYQCQNCSVVITGYENFKIHRHFCKNELPSCIICCKEFSSRRTLRQHIQNLHKEFDKSDLLNYAYRKLEVDCESCLRNFNDEFYHNIFLSVKDLKEAIIFKCGDCRASYNNVEFSIIKYKLSTESSKLILSELCTTEMSDESLSNELVESTTDEVKMDEWELYGIQSESVSP